MKCVLLLTASRVFNPSLLRTVAERVKGRILVPVPVGSITGSPCRYRSCTRMCDHIQTGMTSR
jgi:hypothetical protein